MYCPAIHVVICLMIACSAADPDDLSVNITPSETQAQANQPFFLTCTVVKATGLSGTPTVEWYDALGNLLTPAGSNLPSNETIEHRPNIWSLCYTTCSIHFGCCKL